MVHGALKSRKRYGRTQVKLSKGTTTHYKQRNRQLPKCAVTGEPLKGIPRLTNRKFKNLNKSKKTVSRAYGGYMSAAALKVKILKEMVLVDEESKE